MRQTRLAEFATEDLVLPRFHVWTLGCQMNHSDSEEMAGALLAAGCAEAPSLEAADLIVINTCAIREAAEQKVIGRMGALERLKAANPALRVVLTGCSVRADNAASLPRRYPAVDLFLRPDEEPELAARLGLGIDHGARGAAAGPAPAFQRVGRSRSPRPPTACPPRRAAAVGEGPRRARQRAPRPGCRSSTAATRPAPTASCPSAAARSAAGPSTTIVAEARALAARGYREVTLLGQNVNSYGHDLPPEPRFADVARPARTWAAACDSTAGRTSPRCCAPSTRLRTADGRPAIPRLRFVTSHPWDLTDAAHRRPWPSARRSASTSTCRSSRATTRCCAGWAASTPSRPTSSSSSGCARRSRASA